MKAVSVMSTLLAYSLQICLYAMSLPLLSVQMKQQLGGICSPHNCCMSGLQAYKTAYPKKWDPCKCIAFDIIY